MKGLQQEQVQGPTGSGSVWGGLWTLGHTGMLRLKMPKSYRPAPRNIFALFNISQNSFSWCLLIQMWRVFFLIPLLEARWLITKPGCYVLLLPKQQASTAAMHFIIITFRQPVYQPKTTMKIATSVKYNGSSLQNLFSKRWRCVNYRYLPLHRSVPVLTPRCTLYPKVFWVLIGYLKKKKKRQELF